MPVSIGQISGFRYVADSENRLRSHLCEALGRPRWRGSFSANDLAEFYGLPHETLAKILQRLATAGVLMSHHGIKGGYTLARDPRSISVFDVIKASEGPRRSGIHGEQGRHLEAVPGYHQLRMVHQASQICCASSIEDCYNLRS